MPPEYEAKVLDIDPGQTTKLIASAGGRKLGHAFMRRYVYDVAPGDQSRWIRLRDTGNEITLTVKQIERDSIDGTDEVEVAVGDFEGTNALLGRLGFTPKSYQETRRTSFALEGARLEIDEWPLIRPYLEIEADSHDEVLRVADLLGVPESSLIGENTIKVYARYGIDLNSIAELRFPDGA
jgi:adenylate cyclase class 2